MVDRPDKIGRVAILKVHIKKIKLAEDVDLEKVAGITPGFTGADLANLVNEAAIVATRRGGEKVRMDGLHPGGRAHCRRHRAEEPAAQRP